jgi:hypothetical protein
MGPDPLLRDGFVGRVERPGVYLLETTQVAPPIALISQDVVIPPGKGDFLSVTQTVDVDCLDVGL